MRPSNTIIRLENVTRVFRVGSTATTVLNGVSLDVGRQELLALVGPSGSGKTTLLNLMGGLDQPTSGKVWFDGRDLSAENDKGLTHYRRLYVGFVFQFYNLIPTLTAEENVMAAAEIANTPRPVREMLELVGLWERRHHFPAQLSGGEQQRVAIARALIKQPTLLLCDEPTGAIDLAAARKILRLLVDIHQQLRQTIVIVTHNTAISHLAQRIVHLSSGTIRSVEMNPSPLAPEEIVW